MKLGDLVEITICCGQVYDGFVVYVGDFYVAISKDTSIGCSIQIPYDIIKSSEIIVDEEKCRLYVENWMKFLHETGRAPYIKSITFNGLESDSSESIAIVGNSKVWGKLNEDSI